MTNAKQAPLNRKVLTGKIRSSFLYVVEPKEDMNGNLKFSLEVLTPKGDKATLEAYAKAIENAKTEKWGNNPPSNLHIPVRDGDVAGPSGMGDKSAEPGSEPYGGHFFFTASNTKPVTVLDQNRRPIIVESDIKSGDYFHASLEFYGYEAKNQKGTIVKKGVGVSLRGLMLIEKGEALGSDFDATGDFDSIEAAEATDADLSFLG